MNIETFSACLLEALGERGIRQQTAAGYVKALRRTLTESDLREIAGYRTPEDFAPLADSLAQMIREKTDAAASSPAAEKPAQPGASVPPSSRPVSVTERATISAPVDLSRTKTDLPAARPHSETYGRSTPELSATRVGVPITETTSDPTEEEPEGLVPLTSRGNAFFWTIAVVTLPLTLVVCALLCAAFLSCVLAVCVLIVACFLLIACEAVAGSAATLVGVIYGIIQICTASLGIGIYEIGLGVVCAGAALALGVGTYLLASRGLPLLLRQVLQVARYTLRGVRPFINRVREECNRL